jgi:hypothetical protein
MDNGEFPGGLLLSNRIPKILPVRIITSTDQLKNRSEVGAYFVSKDIQKSGFTLAGVGPGLNPAQQAKVELIRE